MNPESVSIAEGLSTWAAVIAVVVVLGWLGYLLFEVRKAGTGRGLVIATGVLAALVALGAVLRPARVLSRGSRVGPRVVVLVDQSRRLRLPGDRGERREVALAAAKKAAASFEGARVDARGFGDRRLEPLSLRDPVQGERQLGEESDLTAALTALSTETGERPASIVVVSDGRLSRPPESTDDAALVQALGALGVPIHTVRIAKDALKDASIRRVSSAGAAVAHQPLVLHVTIGCAGGLACDAIPVTVQELTRDGPRAELARGIAKASAGEATLDLEVTIERAGRRVIEVVLEAPSGDRVKANDRRLLTLDVTRERVRLLHVAGRPTYDVRQLRHWLKSDESVDLVGFFILRTHDDDPNVMDDTAELSLIPFPVDALFTQHLPTFDAVMLQDIDAVEYKLEPYLPALAAYVRAGGGLIMVGGPSAFAGGGYAGSPLEPVLPVELPRSGEPYDLRGFEPVTTEAGRAAPILRGVTELLGGGLPRMLGSNTVGKPRPGSIVLWEHPERRVDAKLPMPVLALAEHGDGRSIALGVDGTFALGFGELAERAGGRAYGSLWEGLLGWLMRDPRYELGRVGLPSPCIAGEPTELEVVPPPGAGGDLVLTLAPLGEGGTAAPVFEKRLAATGQALRVDAGRLAGGGYEARLRVGAAPPLRFDFACEEGGVAFADSRPDPARLERIASATDGKSVAADGAFALPEPRATEVTVERRFSPILPPWVWTLAAAFALGAHWVVRRQRGLA
jgi:uncharacterized membrane protein